MNSEEMNLEYLLKDLKENHHIIGVKSEFGEEGSSFDEVKLLNELALRLKLGMTLKVGGCEAVRDMEDAHKIGIKSLVAPMIESKYAAQKFVKCVSEVFGENELKNLKLYLNIETKLGYESLNNILSSSFTECIKGIVFGRTDFAGSISVPNKDVDNNIIFDYVKSASEQVHSFGKEFVVGGGVTFSSFDFLKKIEKISKIETRNIIFAASGLLSNINYTEAIKKAMKFEIAKIKNRKHFSKELLSRDEKRIQVLEKRIVNDLQKNTFCKSL